MSRSIFIIIFQLFFFDVFGQKNDLDSLLQVLSEYKSMDTVRIKLYNDIAYIYGDINPVTGQTYIDSSIVLARQLKDQTKEMEALNINGNLLMRQGKDSIAKETYQKVLEYHIQKGNKKSIGILYNNLGLISYNTNDYSKAIEYHLEASHIFQELGLDFYLQHTLNNTGVDYLALSDYPKALEYFHKASKYIKEQRSYGYGNILTNIGLVHKNLNEIEEAILVNKQAIEIFREIGNYYGLANSISNLANCYELQGKAAEAMELHQEALSINMEINNPRKIASDLSNLGILHKGQNDYEKALEYFVAADSLYRTLEDNLNLSLVLSEQVETKILQARTRNSDYDYGQLLPSIKQSVDLANKSGSFLRLLSSWLVMSEVKEAMGDSKGALEAYKMHVIYKDSIFNEENEKAILRQKIGYEFDKKEALLTAEYELEKSLLTVKAKEARLVRNTIIIAFIILSAIAFVIWNLSRKKINAENLQQKAEFKAKVADVELKALRAQMNPHFIFNCLNSISNYMLKNDAVKADQYLQKFSRLIRMILECSDQKEITLSEELEILELYVQLEKLRLNKNLDFEIKVDPSLDKEDTLIPPLLLQPLIENCIWHGISPTDKDGRIVLEIHKNNILIHCKVIDNGVGRNANHSIKENSGTIGKKSMGLNIIRERLRILNDDNTYLDEINWHHLSQGLEVEITLPFNNRF